MSNEKPFVSAAVICEKVLRETDSVISAIRIVDTFYLSPPTASVKKQVLVFVLLISVRRMHLETPPLKHEIKLVLHTPSGQRPEVETVDGDVRMMDDPIIPFVFEAPERDQPASMNVVAQMITPIQEYGGYVFDVFLDGELASQVPFRVLERKDGAVDSSQQK